VQQPDAIGTTASLRLGKPAGVSLIPATDTHWTRILHYDLFTGVDDGIVDAGELAGAADDRRTPLRARQTGRYSWQQRIQVVTLVPGERDPRSGLR